jgi:hypothetical protein
MRLSCANSAGGNIPSGPTPASDNTPKHFPYRRREFGFDIVR